MKYLLINLLVLLFISCSNHTPECNNIDVKENILRLYLNENKPKIVDSFLENLINYEDINNYAWDRGLNVDDLKKTKKEELFTENEKKINSLFSNIKIQNIRTLKTDQEIEKCFCASEIYIPSLDLNENIRYTVQKLEDEETGYWFEIYYN